MEKNVWNFLYVFSNFPHCNILWNFFLDFLSSTMDATIEYWWTTIYTRCEMFEQEAKQQGKTKSERKRWKFIRLNYFFTVVSCLHSAKMQFLFFIPFPFPFAFILPWIFRFFRLFQYYFIILFSLLLYLFFLFLLTFRTVRMTSTTKYKQTIFARYVCKKK